ncbi:MAG TPA: glycosyltransferase [Accumulibacter sp.]|uniref:glycosyltransferase n=1 Tax=Accumulibacter sp. TaxID=2053492 RepID=UPI002B5E11DC|nr:glycosyltransferase [Accumulibacter sp.]HMW55702.1 glycosyltransferase [Accumulibacter sp.]
MNTQIFTVCARNYLAFACALGRSVQRHHPQATFTVWLLDGGELPELPAGIMTRPIEEAISPEQWSDLILRYDILELATAVKPACMLRHFADSAEQVIYIDPDIYLFRPLNEVFDLLANGADGVLTPHIMAPLPRDDSHPDDLDIQRSGLYNLGFFALAVGETSDALLRWWWGWLQTHCFSDPRTGVFTDQKWMNFAPLFWPGIQVLRHSGYNVAYWNLPQRIIHDAMDGDAQNWHVDGEPLVFFHFSGFNPLNPRNLSKHQDRIEIKPWSGLAKILEFYANEVVGFDHARISRLSLPGLAFDNGAVFDCICRVLYRELGGRRFGHPLMTGNGSFYAWITEPLDDLGSVSLTRYLRAIYIQRPDVQAAFPDIDNNDRVAFVNWARRNAVREMNLEPRLLGVETVAANNDVPRLPCVNYVGYLRAEMGVAEAARGYVRVLRRLTVPVACIDVSDLSIHRKEDSTLGELPQDERDPAPHEINIVHINADHLPVVQEFVGDDLFRGCYNIGIWAWETSQFPSKWHDRFKLMNEIWVGSNFMAEAISRAAPIPVITMPHTIDVPDAAPDRASFGLAQDEFVFLFMFDFHSVPARKNPEGAIDAFRLAFTPDQPVRLLIKSMHRDCEPQAFASLQRRAGDARITFLDGTLDSDRRYALLASCDAFLSLHRAEGFGLAIAEAMAMGKPVIATGWSGNMDFMTVANSLPVSYQLEPLAEDYGPYTAGTLWASPDVRHAAELMQRLAADPEFGQRLGVRAYQDIRKHFDTEAVGRQMLTRLQLIAQRLDAGMVSLPQFPWETPRRSRWRSRVLLVARPFWHALLASVPEYARLRLRRMVIPLFGWLRN